MSFTKDWSQFEIKPEVKDFSQYEVKDETEVPEEKSSLLQQFGAQLKDQASNLLRPAARATETVLGVPRAGAEFLESLVPEKLIKKGAEKLGVEKPVEFGLELSKKYAPYKLLPKTEQVRDVTKSLFGKFLEPKNRAQEIEDEVVSDMAALAFPLGSQLKIARPFFTALGAQAAKQGVELFGGSESTQAKTKLGVMLGSTLLQPKKAEQLKDFLYQQAREARPERVKVETLSLDKNLNAIQRQLQQGGSETWKNKIFSKIDEIKEKMAGNSIEVGELEKFKTSLNNIISELYAEKNVSKPAIKSSQRYVNKLAKSVDNSLKEYGAQNPQWEAFYRPANEAHGAIEQSKRVRNFIGRNYKKIGLPGAAALFGIEHAVGIPWTAAGALTGYAGLTAAEGIARIAKSPTLRKHYFNVVNEALKENASGVAKSMEELDKALQEPS